VGCNNARLAEEQRRGAVVFREEVEALWAEHLTIREMARRLEWKTESLGTFICKLRKEGVNLPYRRPGESEATRREQSRRGRELAALNAERRAAA
jgi:hypothetical protein